ncbi:MAG: SCO family protein [Kofleriaceae bacterium]|nr:SCO family protein [Kofleriaceae bacterium]MCB9572185.1 SCO family protein [Kofleriaceae bacterium]
MPAPTPTSTAPRPTARTWAIAVAACALVAAAGAAGAWYFWHPARPAPLPDYGEVPTFALPDQTGGVLDDGWLRGHVTIVDFVFTRCDTICPVLSMKMERLAATTDDVGADVRLLSFSVDPAYDTPEVLATYAAHYHADPARWRFVTGEYDAVKAMIEGALMTAMEDRGVRPTGAPDIKHGGNFLLIDRDLHIRGTYDSNDADRLAALARDVRRLVAAPATATR